MSGLKRFGDVACDPDGFLYRELPFSIELADFRKLDYPGSDMAMAYESDVSFTLPDACDREGCNAQRACPGRQLCQPSGRCDEPPVCIDERDCHGARTCRDGACVDPCQDDAECPGSRQCVDGGCPEADLALEDRFLAALGRTRGYSFLGGRLVLELGPGDGPTALLFDRMDTP